jgi:hypothetical protein
VAAHDARAAAGDFAAIRLLWLQVAEISFDSFMIRMRTRA